MSKDLAILIPTVGGETLQLALQSLFQQTNLNFDIYILEKGNFPMENRISAIFMKLLALKGVEVNYKYDIQHTSIAEARKILFQTVGEKYKYVFTMDDDIVLEPHSIEFFYKTYRDIDFSFIQGKKIEVNNTRNVANDFTLNLTISDEVYIGDGSLTIYNSSYLKNIDWDFIMDKVGHPRVGGEDIMMSLMVANVKPGLYSEMIEGYHICNRVSVWDWFTISDTNVYNALVNKIKPEILKKVFNR